MMGLMRTKRADGGDSFERGRKGLMELHKS